MPNIVPIEKQSFSQKFWKTPSNFLFAKKDSVCPLSALEIPTAVTSLPIAFAKLQENFCLVAVLSLERDCNWAMNSAGRWLLDYVPTLYRGYPFLLIPNEHNNQELVFCFDESSELLTDDSSDNKFFDSDGELTQSLQDHLTFLQKFYGHMNSTKKLCSLFDELGLIKPWTLKLSANGTDKNVGGLYCVDEDSLNNLSNSDFLTLRTSGGLPIIYSQLLAMQNVTKLARLYEKREGKNTGEEVHSFDYENNSTLSFER